MRVTGAHYGLTLSETAGVAGDGAYSIVWETTSSPASLSGTQ